MKALNFIKKIAKYGAYVYAAIECLEFIHDRFEKAMNDQPKTGE